MNSSMKDYPSRCFISNVIELYCDFLHQALWERTCNFWHQNFASGRCVKEDTAMIAKTGTYPLRLPLSLKKAVEELSKKDGTSINQFVVMAVAEKCPH
jgi:hypothetical protein